MDPLKKVKYIIASWESFIQKYRTFRYHGVNSACPKDWLYSPILSDYLLDLTPPVYGVYDFSNNWTKGWAFAYLWYRGQYRADRSSGGLQFKSVGNLERYDTLRMGVVLRGQNCSIQCSISYIDFNIGVYNENIPRWNRYEWDSWFGSELGNIGMHWAKNGYYRLPDTNDYWCWKDYPNRFELNYIVNFKFIPEKNKYIQYDNFGRSKEINNNITATMDLFNYGMLYQSNYPGTAFRYNGINVNKVVFYSDVWHF
ncbi:MAG: hypothetical protein ACUVQP_08550 [Bacteroidales bacterium]